MKLAYESTDATSGRTGLVLAIVLAAVSPGSLTAQDAAPAEDAQPWRETLEYRVGDGSYWWTSNADYNSEGTEAPAYGTAWVLGHGGTAARGCLFSERADGTSLEWAFFEGWDPARKAFYTWQTAESGAVGAGYAEPVAAGATGSMEQTFAWPDGTEQRIKHEADHVHRDTMVTRSFDYSDGKWKPRRTYTWIRRAGDPLAKCSNLAPSGKR